MLKQAWPAIKSTHNEFVLLAEGAFAPELDIMGIAAKFRIKHPILSASTDGPGTMPIWAKIARQGSVPQAAHIMGKNVAKHCFADAACGGGIPIAFLNSIEADPLDPEFGREILEGMASACKEMVQSSHRWVPAMIGGETAQLKGLIVPGATSFSGTVIAIRDKDMQIRPKETMQAGDLVIGVASNGIHLNGTSLFTKVRERAEALLEHPFPPTGRTFAQELIREQPPYAEIALDMLRDFKGRVRGCAHITGDGLPGNIARILPSHLDAKIDAQCWPREALFDWLLSEVGPQEAYATFNMDIGFIFVIQRDNKTIGEVLETINGFGQEGFVIGEIVEGSGHVHISQ